MDKFNTSIVENKFYTNLPKGETDKPFLPLLLTKEQFLFTAKIYFSEEINNLILKQELPEYVVTYLTDKEREDETDPPDMVVSKDALLKNRKDDSPNNFPAILGFDTFTTFHPKDVYYEDEQGNIVCVCEE